MAGQEIGVLLGLGLF